MSAKYAAPPFDPQLVPALAALNERMPSTQSVSTLIAKRSAVVEPSAPDAPWADGVVFEKKIRSLGLVWDRRRIPGLPGDPDVTVSVVQRKDHDDGGPGIYAIHGGGMVGGSDLAGYWYVLDWIVEFDAVAVSVDYRLAPENRAPAPVNDCYAGALWMAAHASDLGFDSDRLLLTGSSAGGGLAAATALLARDSGGPRFVGQVLVQPMLDDRNVSVSSHQFDGIGIWDRSSNEAGWTALLGASRGCADVSMYASPARADDLANLPPTFITVGSSEVFRDECVEYASRIWAAGGVADLHVWAGGFHGYEMFAPEAFVSGATVEARLSFVRRLFASAEG